MEPTLIEKVEMCLKADPEQIFQRVKEIPELVKHLFATDCVERMLLEQSEAEKKPIPDVLTKVIQSKRQWASGFVQKSRLKWARSELGEYIRNNAANGYGWWSSNTKSRYKRPWPGQTQLHLVEKATRKRAGAVVVVAKELHTELGAEWFAQRLMGLVELNELTTRLWLVYEDPEALPLPIVQVSD